MVKKMLCLLLLLAGRTVCAQASDYFNAEYGKLLPGVGTGFRVTVDKETKMNVGMEIAVGLDDWGIYFRLGESF